MNKSIRSGLTFDDVLIVPKKTFAESRSEVDLTSYLTPYIKLKTPLISANMDKVTESQMAIAMAKLGGIGIIHRFNTIKEQVNEVSLVKKEGLIVGAAIGIKSEDILRAGALIKAGADVIVIDIAHGHSEYMTQFLRELKKQFKKTEVIVGNVATAEAAQELIDNGADAIKVGIGPGALCITRVVAGAGMPQLTAIMDVAEVAHKHNIPIIADGGLRYSGDMVKALAAGASTLMIGTLFAGCDESPAVVVENDGKMYKVTRGMASMAANIDRQEKTNGNGSHKNLKAYTPEGVEAMVPLRGSIIDLVTLLAGGIKSGFSYSGAQTIKELWEKAEFIQITQSALIESHPHDVLYPQDVKQINT